MTATFTGTGFGSVANLALAVEGGGGGWKVDNPFGDAMITRLQFIALTSDVCGQRSCDNQSDYVLSSVSAVPEPSTYAMFLAGLGVPHCNAGRLSGTLDGFGRRLADRHDVHHIRCRWGARYPGKCVRIAHDAHLSSRCHHSLDGHGMRQRLSFDIRNRSAAVSG